MPTFFLVKKSWQPRYFFQCMAEGEGANLKACIFIVIFSRLHKFQGKYEANCLVKSHAFKYMRLEKQRKHLLFISKFQSDPEPERFESSNNHSQGGRLLLNLLFCLLQTPTLNLLQQGPPPVYCGNGTQRHIELSRVSYKVG